MIKELGWWFALTLTPAHTAYNPWQFFLSMTIFGFMNALWPYSIGVLLVDYWWLVVLWAFFEVTKLMVHLHRWTFSEETMQRQQEVSDTIEAV